MSKEKQMLIAELLRNSDEVDDTLFVYSNSVAQDTPESHEYLQTLFDMIDEEDDVVDILAYLN